MQIWHLNCETHLWVAGLRSLGNLFSSGERKLEMPSFFTWEAAPLKEKEVLEHVISAAVHWPSVNAGLHRAQLFNSSIKIESDVKGATTHFKIIFI